MSVEKNSVSNRKRVLIVGSTCIDIITVCEQFPVDSDIHLNSQYKSTGGNAANTALVLAQDKDVQAELLTCLSNVSEERFVSEQFKRDGIHIDNCRIIEDKKLPFSLVVLHEESSRTVLHSKNNFPSLSLEDFKNVSESYGYDWIHFEGRNLKIYSKMIEYLKQLSSAPYISIKIEKTSDLDYLNYIFSNVNIIFIGKDAATTKGYTSAEETVSSYINNIPIQSKLEKIVCTWGDLGAFGSELTSGVWVSHKSNAHHCEKVIDGIGKGDTFIAGAILKLVRGIKLKKAMDYGCLLAGLKCSQFGFDNLMKKRSS